jgi:Arc/MetJ-type ribon-helix-helix transcriptional regulator
MLWVSGWGCPVSKTYVETSSDLLVGVDRMVKDGFYHDRTEAVNDAIQQLLKAYKLSKLYVKDGRRTGGTMS